MMRRALATAGTILAFAIVLLTSRGQRPPNAPAATKLPLAIGAIQPRLSPDGSMLAFSYQGDIWIAPRTGGTMTVLASADGFDSEPAWSPDGERIAFVRGAAVKLIRAKTGEDVPLPKALTTGGTYAVNKLEFSADGKKLFGTFRVDGKDLGLAWFDLATGESKSLSPVHFYSRFGLSPDGKWIAYTVPPDQPGEQTGNNGSYTDLFKMSADGGVGEKIARFPARIHDISWVDGRSLIVSTELGQAHDDLWQLPLDDPLRGMRKLTSGQADEDRPTLSRDGKWLAYTDNRAGATSIVVRNMVNSEEGAVRFDAMDYKKPTGTIRLRVVDTTIGQADDCASLVACRAWPHARPARQLASQSARQWALLL